MRFPSFSLKLTVAAIVALALAGCKGGGNPNAPTVDPSAPTPNVNREVRTIRLRAFVNHQGNLVSTDETFVTPGNVPGTVKVLSVTARIEGGANCPEQFEAAIVAPTGRHIDTRRYWAPLPCIAPTGVPAGSVLYYEGPMDELKTEPLDGRWTMTGVGHGNSTPNEIKVTLTITREVTVG